MMKLLREKYWKLKPSFDLLSDELILTQAWKKSHSYIRTRNWYADTLALDVSALTIEESVKKWRSDLGPNLTTHKAELILAGKSETWEFSDKQGWQPTELVSSSKSKSGKSNSRLPLRPLSHLSVRDQTYATAVMLCLADCIESRQGECTEDPFSDQRNKVCSYGNRLVCDWRSPHDAWFRWGNSESYRKFFVDYQNFLSRPASIGQSIQKNLSGEREVYIVSLDLKSFFNSIDLAHLNDLLLKMSNEDKSTHTSDKDEVFWLTAKRVLNWTWDIDEVKHATKLGLKDVAKGLPQGLVASGFFANVYMIEFDEAIISKIDKPITKTQSVWLHDYCRYVDDLRLVVSAEINNTEELKGIVDKFVQEILDNSSRSTLKINKDKTKVNPVADLASSGSMSHRLRSVQQELSGPNDRDSLDTTLGILESLLTPPSSAPGKNTPPSNKHERQLYTLIQYDHDVRADTLKRFAANRLESVVKEKRRISLSMVSETDNELLADTENELLAKKLIHAWTTDPSLVLLIRKAMEIYPDAKLFEPVLQVIFDRSSFADAADRSGSKKNSDTINQAIMNFLLADLFRCGVDFVYYFNKMDFPSSLEPKSILELLSRFAVKTLNREFKYATFVRRQALMLLAALNRPTLVGNLKSSDNSKSPNFDGIQQLTLQNELLRILSGLDIQYRHQTAVLFEIASQITGQYDSYARRFLEIASKRTTRRLNDRLLPFAKRGGLFWENIWTELEQNRKQYSPVLDEFKWARPYRSHTLRRDKQTLFDLITSNDHIFAYEHSLLKLAKALLMHFKATEAFFPISLHGIPIKLGKDSTWNELHRPSTDIHILKDEVASDKSKDPRYIIPNWIDDDEDKRKVYWIGMVLRAAILGSPDYTGNLWHNSKVDSYKGVKATWFKRRMAMMHSPESMVGEDATVSDWFSELLMKCLQWPGFEVSKIQHRDIAGAADISQLIQVIENRIVKLDSLYCGVTDVPSLPTRVGPNLDLNNFRIVTVQPVLPKPEWFTNDIELNRATVRASHREHIASVCSLVYKTLETRSSAAGNKDKRSANLIVFPEISVHIDDQDLIKSLADKTKAIVFAGMVFNQKDGKLVNFGRWFIPNYRGTERTWMFRDQGKQNLIPLEKANEVQSHRPCQHFLEVFGDDGNSRLITGAICYDATDINLSADLRDKSDLFIVAAYNPDVATFDNMAKALHWHMYQHVVIANIGIYGGSTIQAPYKQPYDKIIAHVHGSGQIAINMADIDLDAFTRKVEEYKQVKSRPAGFERDRVRATVIRRKRKHR
ncbi:reverse transcriptase domain-containing protein [Pseudidiomarina planktonica]|nr:reverse transcriptase domain-containing protein [Pseudidiomarina planktonica]